MMSKSLGFYIEVCYISQEDRGRERERKKEKSREQAE